MHHRIGMDKRDLWVEADRTNAGGGGEARGAVDQGEAANWNPVLCQKGKAALGK